MIVLDASATVSWLLKETVSTDGLDDLLIHQRVLVPAHWTIEVGHAILKTHRRKQIAEDRLNIIANDLASLDPNLSPPLTTAGLIPLLQCARENGRTMYDAGYVKLAVERSSALATLDNGMRKAAEKLGVALAL